MTIEFYTTCDYSIARKELAEAQKTKINPISTETVKNLLTVLKGIVKLDTQSGEENQTDKNQTTQTQLQVWETLTQEQQKTKLQTYNWLEQQGVRVLNY